MFRIFAFTFVFIGINAGLLSAQDHQDVLVLFRQHPDWQHMRTQFDQQNLPVSTRAIQLIQELKAVASTSQHGFSDFLSGLQAEAELLHSYYIINAATVRVSENHLGDLQAFPEVEAVIALKNLPVYAIQPVEKREAVSRAVGSHETGATVIGAPFMWNLGYTGLGRKLYTVDTGVWPVHPAIRRQWLGNHLTQQQVWYGFDSDNPADKSDAHGTHVTGTVLGLDSGTADTIGIAFNARFMAADPIVEDVADIKPITTILEAFEFALNPDGNDQTTNDIPDVICNSWGVGDSIADGLCTAPFLLDLFTALDMAGIAVEFSAGNEGPAVSSISLPQYVTMDSLSIFTVGALDGNSQNLTIASFSSRGPTTCDVPDEWKIKPEVSAPGVDVRSSVQWDSYAFYSGTSMAGPHVAGAVLLLKEAFPTLSGREILNALYQSANDLGETGEDNVYGKGVINLENAYNFLAQNNEPVPPLQSGFDVTITGFNLGEVVCEGTHDVKVNIANIGTEALDISGEITLQIDGQAAGTATSSGTLQPGESSTFTVTSYSFNTGLSELQASISLFSNVLEREIINNSRVSHVHVQPLRELPFGEGFEYNSLDGNDLLLINPDFADTWDTISTGGLGSSHYSARQRFITYGRKKQLDKIYLPALNIPPSADSVILRFDYAYRYRSSTLADSLFVEWSDDCGDTWNAAFVKGGEALATVDTSWTLFKPFSSGHWANFKFDLKPLISGNTLLVRFTSYNAGGSLLYIDNIGIYTEDDPTTVFTLPNALQLKLFPNPAGETLNLVSDTQLSNSTITISDLSGRLLSEVLVKQASTSFVLETAQLPAGLYLIQLRCDEGIFRSKFLK